MELSIGGHVAIEMVPSITGGGAIGGGVRIHDVFSATLEARLDAPQSRGDIERVSAHFVGGALVLCGHLWLAGLCGVLTIGALRGEGAGVDEPRQVASLFAMAGARAQIDAPLFDWLSLRAFAEFGATLTPTTLDLDDRVRFVVPPVSATIGTRAVVRWP